MKSEPCLVNCDVVMEPAERGEIVRVVVTMMGTVPNVVGLESVAATTAGNGAALVTPRNEVAHRRRNGGG